MRVVLLIALLAIYALVRELHLGLNIDNSWLLYAAQRVVDGQKPYVDMMETNPPLILWLSMLPVYIGKWLHIEPKLAFPWLVTAAHLGLLWLVYSVMHAQKIVADKLKYILLAYFGIWAFFFTTMLYGQREILWIALVLPYLLQSLGSEKRYSLMVALLAAIGFALKPFFLFLWIFNELAIACEKRSLRPLFYATNWIIGIMQVGYVLAIYYFTPEYITDLLPIIKATYFSYEARFTSVLAFLFFVMGITGFLVWLARAQGDVAPFIKRIYLWMVACALVVLCQRKLWLNHEYPIIFMAGFILVLLLVSLCRDWQRLKLEIGHRKFISLCLVAVLMVGVTCMEALFTYLAFTQPSKMDMALRKEIDQRAPGEYVYPLAYKLSGGFPLILESRGVFRGSFHCLWPLSGIIVLEQQQATTHNENPELAKIKTFFFDALIRDFTEFPPKLVWVHENIDMQAVSDHSIAPENQEILPVLLRDKRFAKLWKNYKKVSVIEGGRDAEYPEKEPMRIVLYELEKP